MNTARSLLVLLGLVFLCVVVLWFLVIEAAYFVDYMRGVFVDGKWAFLFLIWLFPLSISLGGIAVASIGSPLMHGLQGVTGQGEGHVLALALVPVGAGFTFLMWQGANWFFYGLLDFEPWAYNFVFGWIGLSI